MQAEFTLETWIRGKYLTETFGKQRDANLGRSVGLDDGVPVGLSHDATRSDVGLGLVVNVLRVRLKSKGGVCQNPKACCVERMNEENSIKTLS